MNTFNTEVDIEITGNELENPANGKATIAWGMEIEARNWGVKNFSIIVPEQTITCVVERFDFDTEEETEESEEGESEESEKKKTDIENSKETFELEEDDQVTQVPDVIKLPNMIKK